MGLATSWVKFWQPTYVDLSEDDFGFLQVEVSICDYAVMLLLLVVIMSFRYRFNGLYIFICVCAILHQPVCVEQAFHWVEIRLTPTPEALNPG